MGVYIKGMDMPTGNDELRLIIHSNGQVIISHKTHCEEAEAVPVPPHGDLIDREYAIATASSGRIRVLPTTEDGERWIRVKEVRDSIKAAPTIIPAEPLKDEAPAGPYDLLYEEGGPDA